MRCELFTLFGTCCAYSFYIILAFENLQGNNQVGYFDYKAPRKIVGLLFLDT